MAQMMDIAKEFGYQIRAFHHAVEAALLRRAGVKVVLVATGGSDVSRYNARNIKYEAGNAVAYGMNYDDALRAITLAPAELFGLSDRIGSLQAGRDANVVVWSGGGVELVDADEFEQHRIELAYPEALVADARRAATDVLTRVQAGMGPFSLAAASPWLSALGDAVGRVQPSVRWSPIRAGADTRVHRSRRRQVKYAVRPG